MYLTHYDLKKKPFQISTDPKFIWLGENHKETLAILEYGVLDNKGFLFITGDVGTGKTTLINALLQRLGKDVIVANITNPILEELEFYNFIADEFNMNMKFISKGSFLIHFRHFLNDCYSKNKRVILIVDEAHKLSQKLLEQIRLLSNIERPDTKLLNIFFVGQNEFIDIISDTKNRALKQRISINFHLDPLTKTEVREYIHHRLKVAGHKGNVFSQDATDEIFSFSKGYPRLINIICDHALLTGYVNGLKTIKTAEIIKECSDGLLFPTEHNDYYNKEYNREIETIEEIAINPERKASIKSPGKKFKHISIFLLLFIILGIVYYPFKLDSHIGNSKKYFNLIPNREAKLKSPDMSQIGSQNITLYPILKDSEKSYNTHPLSRDLASKNNKISGQKEDIADLPKRDKINQLSPTENLNQEDHLNNVTKIRKVPMFGSISDQKNIIYFGYASSDLSDEAFETLKQLTELIAQYPDLEIIVKGYTDSYGDYNYNKKLSILRANLVGNFFVAQGISASRIRTLGLGPEDPIESNKTSEGRRLNRRVEIKLNCPERKLISHQPYFLYT
jgi:general secretion pathway protein A